MSEDLLGLALLVLVVLVGSALCSGVEAALLSVNPLRVHELAAEHPKVRGAKKLEKLRHRLGRTLTVLTIANNNKPDIPEKKVKFVLKVLGSLKICVYGNPYQS